MVKLIVGAHGTGKTKDMVTLANDNMDMTKGTIVFISRDHKLMLDLSHRIRVICMEDYQHITNIDEYIGFIYGIISSDYDIKEIYIDSILKHADVKISDLEEFFGRLARISELYGPDFIVSLSAGFDEVSNYCAPYKLIS